MICDCEDWAENIEKVHAPIVLQSVRSGGSYQYDGKMFTHCPWCGDELQADPEEAWAARNDVANGTAE